MPTPTLTVVFRFNAIVNEDPAPGIMPAGQTLSVLATPLSSLMQRLLCPMTTHTTAIASSSPPARSVMVKINFRDDVTLHELAHALILDVDDLAPGRRIRKDKKG